MRIHVIFSTLLVGALISACATKEPDPLMVRMFHMKTTNAKLDTSQMVRGEHQYRLRGAVTKEERNAKLGQYYTIHWCNVNDAPAPLRVVMDYQQAATGSKILKITRELPAERSRGEIEFHVTGENFRRNGRVLSWRVRLMSGQKILDEKRSYLWR